VYAARVIEFLEGDEKRTIPGVANYGIRPTYELGNEPLLEIHMLENRTIGYDADVAVELVEFIRPEQKFETQEALVAQIRKDVEIAKLRFSLK
jgi:riboflavin kinase/FMN adenylyltransferase